MWEERGGRNDVIVLESQKIKEVIFFKNEIIDQLHRHTQWKIAAMILYNYSGQGMSSKEPIKIQVV